MCGIAGIHGAGGHANAAASALIEGLAHRGPDGASIRNVGPWTLAQTRLAIVDLSETVQYPMPNEARDLWLVFNGEIYNHVQLRRDLEARGHSFRTRCDAEVVVHGYEEWGTGLFPRLHGMWALGLVDERTGDLVLARDALGIKPLVHTCGEPFAFASEAMVLVSSGLSAGAIDMNALDEFLAFHYVPSPLTGVQDIVQIEPGFWLKRGRDGHHDEGCWAQRPFAAPRDRRPVDLEEADATLSAAVGRQLEADVSVGVLLSGGIDSSLIVAYAVEAGHRPTTVTIGFEGAGDYDESASAAAVARHFGVPNHVEHFAGSFLETVGALGRAYDSPFADPSAIATLRLARLARRHFTVALSGTGGDDLFAGYARHRVLTASTLASLAPRRLREAVARHPTRRGEERMSRTSLARSHAVRLAASTLQPPGTRYLATIGTSTSSHALGAVRHSADLEAARARVALRHGRGDLLTLDQIQAFELRTYVAGDLLVKEDRATMAHSLEGRVPLLDDTVVDLAGRTTLRQRTSWRSGKLLLRELARRKLPRRRAGSPKRGFAVPLGLLLAGPWRPEADGWLRASASEIIDGHAAAALLGNEATAPLDVWALCALRAWEDRLVAARRSAQTTRLTTS